MKSLKTLKQLFNNNKIFSKYFSESIKINPKETSIKSENISKIEIKKYPKRKEREELKEEIVPIPLSPVIGPIDKYRWCSCGQSFSQPFCDGKHKGTMFKPVRFTIEQECTKISLCGCKYTENPPYCDGKTCKNLKNTNI